MDSLLLVVALVITHILARSQPADAGGRVEPGVERGSAEPQESRETKSIEPANAGGS
jgi:hypothetical protein